MCVPSFSQRRTAASKAASSTIGTLNSNKQLLMSLPPLKFDAAAFYYPPLPEPSNATISTTTSLEHNKQSHQHTHIIVQHDYHDRACESKTPSSSTAVMEDIPITRGGVAVPFPPKLHEMLQQVQVEGLEHIVSWQPHGRCFLVHDPKGFVDVVLPKYFKQSKLASFQRQLNLYGFQRLTKGNDKGGYYHEYFLRGRPDLCPRIHRLKVKGTGVRARSNPDAEPNLWQMTWIGPDGNLIQSSESTTAADAVVVALPQAKLAFEEEETRTIPSRVSSDSTMMTQAAAATTAASSSSPSPSPFYEDLFFFEGRAFHALEAPTTNTTDVAAFQQQQQQQIAAAAANNITTSVDDDDSSVLDFDDAEMDSLLSDIKLPSNFHLDIIDTIDDDVAFGNLLERLIDDEQ